MGEQQVTDHIKNLIAAARALIEVVHNPSCDHGDLVDAAWEVKRAIAAAKHRAAELRAGAVPATEPAEFVATSTPGAFAFLAKEPDIYAATEPKPEPAAGTLRTAAANCTGEMFGEAAAVKPEPAADLCPINSPLSLAKTARLFKDFDMLCDAVEALAREMRQSAGGGA